MSKPLRFMFVHPVDYKSLVETGFPHLGLGQLSASIKKRIPGVQTLIVRGHLQEWIHDWQPDIVGITAVSQYWDEAKFHAQRSKQGGLPVIVGGVHVTALPETMTEDMDVAVLTEGEQTIVDLVRLFQAEGEFRPASLRSIPGVAFRENGQLVKIAPRPMIPNLDLLPHIDRTILAHSYHTGMFTSRGCPYHCFVGGTIIHTIEGDVPISTQVGREDVMVLTRDPETQEPMYAKATHICKTQVDAELVRVHFDDGSHIDCTPEQKFKEFSYKNQTVPKETEREIEAKDLQPKQQVRAVRFEVQKSGRVTISTRRDINAYRGDLVLEAMLGRKLVKGERCHHGDRNPGNDSPRNVSLTDKHNHTKLHPEIAERMRRDNPAKNMTPEWRQKLTTSVTGKRRTLAQRLRYRDSKLGAKNPRYDPTITDRKPRKSRIYELMVNHKVSWVEKLEQRQDVYCMEVPGVHWFYANKVLVHNCTFCASTRYWPKMRFNSAAYVAEEICRLHSEGVTQITFLDDLFVADKRRLVEIHDLLGCKGLLGKISYICNVRSNLVTNDLCRLLHDMNVKVVGIGMESANPTTLAYLKGEGNISVEDHAKAFQRLTDHGIVVHPSFIIGSPLETREQIMDTYRFIREYRIPDFEMYVLMPFPGTPVWDYAAQRGLVGPDMKWDRLRYHVHDFGPGSIVLSERLTYEELNELYGMFNALRVKGRRIGMVKQAIKHPMRAVGYVVKVVQGNETLPEPYPPRR